MSLLVRTLLMGTAGGGTAIYSGPTVAASSKASSIITAGATGVVVTKPTGTVSGSVLYAFCGVGEDGGAPMTSTGWTQVANGTASAGDDRALTVLRKVCGGSEPADYTFTNTQVSARAWSVIIVRVEGAHQTVPEDVVGAVSTPTDDFTPAAPAVTTVGANVLALTAHLAVQASIDLPGIKTAGAPSGWTLIDSTGINGTGVSATNVSTFLEVAWKPMLAAGTTGTDVWTGTPDDATAEGATVTLGVAKA
jgi:hypothetical protein